MSNILIDSITINGHKIELVETCPECNGKGETTPMYIGEYPGWCSRCEGTGQVQKYITPEQYKELTGEELPDDCAVWFLWDHEYHCSRYGSFRRAFSWNPPCVLALGPAPDKDWRTE